MTKHISREGLTLELQAKEEMDRVKARSLTETAAMNTELQYIVALINKMGQGQRRPIKYLKHEVKNLRRGKIYAPHLEQWSEDMDSAITPVLELLDEQMKHLEINSSTGGGGVGLGISDMESFEYKWKGQLKEVADRIDGVELLAGGRWFGLLMMISEV